MTELEAEALAARSTRIWVPEWFKANHNDNGSSYYTGYFKEKVILNVDIDDGELNFDLYRDEALLSADITHGLFNTRNLVVEEEHLPIMEDFTAQWLPFFRRGCWLSGCPIEASAHEKAEWVQGFSSEEVESWNLEM